MRRLLDAFPVDAALAFVGCGLCRDGAGDAGINRLDAPKVKLCRVSVSRTVSGGECAASCTTGICPHRLEPSKSPRLRSQRERKSLEYIFSRRSVSARLT